MAPSIHLDRAGRAALDSAYRTFGFRVQRRALSITGREEDAHDVTQAVFIQLARSLATLRNPAGIASWIYVTTTREALQLLRRRGRQRERETRWSQLEPSSSPSPEARTAAAQRVVQLVDSASDETLEAALLYFVDQLPQDEIARMLGVSRRTVIRRINAFRLLAQELERRQTGGA